MNLSEANACIKYTGLYPTRPDWGIDPDGGSEPLTQTLMCCKGSIWGGAEESFLYELAAKKYKPVWYDRSEGWLGQSYVEAAEFCSSKGDTKILCPFEACE